MLQSLEVFGFKSFADRTTFAFAPGITCVVGPNGSGKSNVVDAMKWLLGDQSPKNLRGKQMSDVIFNGSRTRKASGLAEATLSFDNRQGILSTPLQDVRITRRLYQGGDSEYLINGEICRLKDIRELFVGTGAATSAYSIIEQGRVGQVLQGNASTRRVLFDEAAGISKFKSRRDDATTKLERVSQNLLRLTDIVDEVESQLNACRSRAGKAAKYRELAVQYDAVRLGLAADDVRLLSRQRQGLRERQQLASSQLHETQQKLSAVETERDSLRDRFRDADEELQRREAKLSTLMQQRSSLETSLKHLDDRSREIESDIQVLRRQRHDLKLRVHDIEEEISREEADWKLAEQQVQTIDAQRNRLEAARTAQQDQLELLRLERQRLQSQLGELQRQQAACESHLKHLHVREETTRNAIAERQLEQEQTSQLLQEKEAEVARYSARYEAVLQEHRQLRQEQDASIRQRDQVVDQLNTMTVRQAADREQRSAWEARLGLLKDMEERQLGLSIGVQEILDRSRRSPLPPWKHVLGVVVDFFECDLEYAPLVEIALGHDAQAIVVDRISPIAEYLDRQSIPFEGRLSFLELPQNGTRESASADPRLIEFAAQLKETQGIVGRADQFLRCESLHRSLFEQLLNSTWIVETLELGRKLIRSAPPGIRLLTLQGDLLQGGGHIQTGVLQPEGSIVSRRAEILRIRQELSALTRSMSRMEESMGALRLDQESLEQTIEQSQEHLDQLSTRLAEEKHSLLEIKNETETVRRDLERVTSDLSSLTGQLESVQQEKTTQTERAESLRGQILELDQLIDQQNQQAQAINEKLRGLHDELELVKVEATKIQQKQLAVEGVKKRLLKDRELRLAQYHEAKLRLENGTSKQAQIDLQILNSRSRLAELYLIGEQFSVSVVAARRMRSDIQSQRDRLNEQLRSHSEVRREQEQILSDLRIEQRDLENQLGVIEQGIRDDYSIPLAELLRNNISSYEAAQAIHHGQDIPPLIIDLSTLRKEAPTALTHEVELAETEDVAVEQEVPSVPDDSAEREAWMELASDWTEWTWENSEESFLEQREKIESELQRLQRRIKALGAVDPESLHGLDELETRFRHLNTQLQDLKHAKATLEQIIDKINTESRRLFVESFTAIRTQFKALFRQLFGGGEGDIIMEDENDPLECGIEVVARPPGKELRSISLLSGGEKTMTAVGLLLAIFKSRPSPFCILDECDAALDEANIDRFANVIKEFKDKTQFIVISHRKRTMTAADRIFGVTMEEAGVSKRLTVRFEDVGENGEILSSSQSKAA